MKTWLGNYPGRKHRADAAVCAKRRGWKWNRRALPRHGAIGPPTRAILGSAARRLPGDRTRRRNSVSRQEMGGPRGNSGGVAVERRGPKHSEAIRFLFTGIGKNGLASHLAQRAARGGDNFDPARARHTVGVLAGLFAAALEISRGSGGRVTFRPVSPRRRP